jgi:hypothetical protein
MTTDNPFGPGGPFYEAFRRQRELAELVKRTLGPAHELRERMRDLEGSLASFRELERSGVLGTIHAAANLSAERAAALDALATPAWLLAVQQTAASVARRDPTILKTQELLAASAVSDVVTLARTFEANRSTMATVMAASQWGEQFRSLSESLAPTIAGIKLAAERARALDMLTLRATADAVAKSATMAAAEQVLKAHRLLEAMGEAQSPEQSASLFAALLSVMAAIFSGFHENTVKELRGVGSVKLLEIFMLAVAIWQFATPADLSPAQQKVVAEMQAEFESMEDKLDKILATTEAANEAYVAELPRAELRRSAAICREGQARARVLMRGEAGMLLAVKESRGRWRLVVYRDPLTDQLSEGWVHAPAVRMLDQPEELSRR